MCELGHITYLLCVSFPHLHVHCQGWMAPGLWLVLCCGPTGLPWRQAFVRLLHIYFLGFGEENRFSFRLPNLLPGCSWALCGCYPSIQYLCWIFQWFHTLILWDLFLRLVPSPFTVLRLAPSSFVNTISDQLPLSTVITWNTAFCLIQELNVDVYF